MSIGRGNANFANATSVALTNPIAVGDLIIVIGNWSDPFSGQTVTDTQSNSYTQQTSGVHNTVNGYGDFFVFSALAKAASTPTMTVGGSNASRLAVLTYTGFLGLPTILTADVNQAQAAASTAVNSGNVIASQNNEHFIAWGNNDGGTVFGSNAQFSSTGVGGFQIVPKDTLTSFPTGLSSGTTVAYSCTLSAADNWSVQVLGFYDGPLPPGTQAPIYHRKNVLYFI